MDLSNLPVKTNNRRIRYSLEKRVEYRNPAWLASAKGEECTMESDWCNYDSETTVAAHSNYAEDGKGLSQKADDCFVAFVCSGCHAWYDFGKEPAEEKREAFHRAFKKTIRRLLDRGLLRFEK